MCTEKLKVMESNKISVLLSSQVMKEISKIKTISKYEDNLKNGNEPKNQDDLKNCKTHYSRER